MVIVDERYKRRSVEITKKISLPKIVSWLCLATDFEALAVAPSAHTGDFGAVLEDSPTAFTPCRTELGLFEATGPVGPDTLLAAKPTLASASLADLSVLIRR